MAAHSSRGDGTDALEALQMKANAVTDESLESTRRMIRMCEESQAAGTNTLQMLEEQGEQLDRIEGGLDNINAEMKQADKHLTGMEKWCGLFVCPCNRRQKIKDVDEAEWEKRDNATAVRVHQPRPYDQQEGGRPKNGGPYIERITNDAREDEMEDNLQAVGGVLGNLRSMAMDMGNEIEKQNQQLDKIGAKASVAQTKVDSANKRTEKLLK